MSFGLLYLDYTENVSDGWSDHMRQIGIVLDRIRGIKIKVKLSRCKSERRTIKYLVRLLINNAGNNPRLIRLSLNLQPYHYTIKHRIGKEIALVDYLKGLNKLRY